MLLPALAVNRLPVAGAGTVRLPGLELVRRHSSLSRQHLAARAGIHVATVIESELGEAVSVRAAQALAKALKVQLVDLLPGSGVLV